MPDEWVSVARLGRTRGLRGELHATGYGGSWERLRSLGRVVVFSKDGLEIGPFTIGEVRPYRDGLVMRFVEAPTIAEAEALAGGEVRIRYEDRPAAPEGEFYVADLAGCRVIDRRTGRPLGTVAGWQDAGGTGLLEVEREGSAEPWLLPFARSICVEIDPAHGRIVVDLPEGLDELR